MAEEKYDTSAIIELFADECIRGILSLTSKKEHSATGLSDELNRSKKTIKKDGKVVYFSIYKFFRGLLICGVLYRLFYRLHRAHRL